MSVYASNTWGSTDSNDKACIGLWFYETGNTATSYTFRADAWIWTKWAIHDSDNNWYWDRKRGSAPAAETQYASRDIYTTVSSGSGWSDSNQQKIDSGSYTYTKEHSWYYIYIRIYLSGVAGCGAMAHNGWVGIPPKDSYTVSYNANGGSGAPGSQTKWYGENLTLSSNKPTRTGYTFKGWATSSTGGVAYASGATYAANSGVTLYAVWSINIWQVTYNGNGATSGVPGTQTKIYGQTLTLSSNTPARSGYTFRDWSGNNGVIYARGASYTTNAALALTARWKYTVTYNGNGATSGVPSTQETPMGSATTLSSSKPVRNNYTFKNWLGSNGTSYNPGGSYTGASLTLTAQWYNHYSITYNANGGSGVPATQTKVQGTATTISSTVPTRENYRFTGWNTKDDGLGTAYASGASYSTDAPLNLYAQWQILYISPTIGEVTAYRCKSSTDSELFDEGTNAFISFDWSVDRTVYSDNVGTSVSISYKQRGSSGDPTVISNIPALPSQASGIFEYITDAIFETDYTYDLEITLNDDGHGSQSINDFISLAYYIVDFKNGGHGIGFGGTADEDLMKVYMESKFIGDSNFQGDSSFQGAANFQGTTAGRGLLDFVYPVGSIYMSVNSTSPEILFGGRWQQLQNTFLLAAGSSYTAGSTGGAATVTLTTDNLPSHTHTYNKPPTGTGGHTLTVAQMPSHQHGVVKWKKGTTTTQQNVGWYSSDVGSGSKWQVLSGSDGNQQYDCGTVATGGGKSHSHTITSTSANTGGAGSGTAVNKMPPYLAVYMWKRIADA